MFNNEQNNKQNHDNNQIQNITQNITNNIFITYDTKSSKVSSLKNLLFKIIHHTFHL